jgi:PAS domain S-box-containing protein
LNEASLTDRVAALEAENAQLRAQLAANAPAAPSGPDNVAGWLRSIADAMPVLISYVDRDQRFRFANKAYERRFGRALDTIVGHALPQVMGDAVYEARRAYVERALAGEHVVYEVDFPGPDGLLHTVVEHIPDRGPSGEVLGFYALVQDVTEHRRAERALRDSEARLRALTDNLPNAFIYQLTSSPDMSERRYTYVSATCERLIGVKVEDALRDPAALMGLIQPDSLPGVIAAEQAAARSLSVLDIEVVGQTPDGRLIRSRIVSQPRPSGDGQLIWDGLLIDVTDRRRTQEALRESEERFRRIADSAPVPMWVTGLDRKRQFANIAYVEFLGVPYDEAIDFDWRKVLHPDDAHRIYAEQQAKESTLQPFSLEARYRRADGSWRWLRSESQPRFGPSGEHVGFIGVAYDITEAKQAQFDLEHLNELLEGRVARRTAELQTLYDKAPVPLHSMNVEGTLTSVSDRWLDLMGYEDRAEVLGRLGADFLTAGSRARLLESDFPGLLKADVADDVEYQAVKRSGDVMDVLISSRIARDAQGRFQRTMGAVVDVTARKRAEEQLRQAQKMDAIGQLTGGVAHDFNNLLTPVIGSLDLLRGRVDGDARAERLLDGAVQAAERASTLVQRLLAFSRRQKLQPCPTDIARLVEEMRDLVQRSIGPLIDVEVAAPAAPLTAMVDPNQLELALLNLAVNARDAMPDGGRLRIETAPARVGSYADDLPVGDYVRLSVTDTGGGMDTDTLARAVEPFFSTKAFGKGTGLGLSMVHGMAAQSGGALKLSSRPGEGTTAELWLPVADPAAGTLATDSRPTADVRPSTVLLVDDEALVRASVSEMLRTLGCKVVECEGGEGALEVLQSRSDIDMIVTDHLMPHMKGADLASRARALRPNLPVLLITGYAGAEVIDPTLPQLSKPFRAIDLAGALARLRPAQAD